MPRIVVVDDSALIRRKVASLLASAGHEVVSVASGEEAVERTLREPFDLVVSDVRMGAMTGVQLCRVLRSDPLTRAMPVLLLTASDDARSRFWARHGGVDAYLTKDDALARLLPTVDDLLASRSSTSGNGIRRPSHVDAAARVSAVLDRHLFEAVVSAEVRALFAYADDRARFLAAAAEFLRDVFASTHASLTIHGHETSHAIVLRRASLDADEARRALGLGDEASSTFVVSEDASSGGAFEPGVVERFVVESSGEELGELRLYGGHERIGSDDRATAGLVVASLVPVLRGLLLFEETRRLAQVDVLTNLANRRTLVERLELEDRRVARYGGELSVILVDVDHFKSVNDVFGHAAGDEVLRAVGKVLASAVRNVDLAGRWGGEEFLLVLPSCDAAGAMIVGERIRSGIAALGPFESGPPKVTASCGIATRTHATPGAFALVELADGALYAAKRGGRDRVVASGG